MTTNKNWIINALLICGCCIIGCSSPLNNTPKATKASDPVILTLKLNMTVFALGEPIVATVTVRNAGKTPVTTNWFSINGGFALRLETIDGTPIMMDAEYGETAHPLTHFMEPLKPGQAYTTTLDITRADIAESSSYFPRLAHFRERLTSKIGGYIVSPDTYKLKAVQVLDYTRTSTSQPKGVYTSATFTIREPNETEKEALRLFETQPLFTNDEDSEARKTDAEQSQLEAISAFDKIWNDYRDTVYAPYALYYAARVSQKMGDNSGAIRKYETLESSSKDFPLMADLHYYKTIALKDSGKKDKALIVGQQLKDKYWDHIVAPTVETKCKGSSLRNLVSDLGIK